MTTEEFIGKIPFAAKARALNFLDCGLVAIYKGHGIMAHPNPSKSSFSQVAIVRAKYNLSGEYFSWIDPESGQKMRLHLINRLDSPTSGIILAATNSATANAVKKAFKEKSVKKTYYAVCAGRTLLKEGMWSDNIVVKKSPGFVRSSSAKPADQVSTRKAVSKFSLVKIDSNDLLFSLLKLEPITGRTHQLRMQCAKHKLPIIGDATYGNFKLNKDIRLITGENRMFLHCAGIELDFNLNDEAFSFKAEAPLPKSFDMLLEPNGKLQLYKQQIRGV